MRYNIVRFLLRWFLGFIYIFEGLVGVVSLGFFWYQFSMKYLFWRDMYLLNWYLKRKRIKEDADE